MKITEAMAEIKLANKKIQSSMDFVVRNIRREDWRLDPFAKEGTTQEAMVKAELQSARDNMQRVVQLKHAINEANRINRLEVAGISMTIAEWLIYRRDVLPLAQRNVTHLANLLANVNREVPVSRWAGQATERDTTNWIINVSDKELIDEIQKLNTIEERLDGALSLANATIDIDV